MKNLKEFIALLPEDGVDYVTPSSVNIGPEENRKDIIFIQDEIGKISDLVYEKTQDFNSDSLDIKLKNSQDNIVNKINQLKSDVGNKEKLNTERTNNIVFAINDIKKDMYRNTRLEDILARYTMERRGNFIKSGFGVNYQITSALSSYYSSSWYANFIATNTARTTVSSFGRRRTMSFIMNQLLSYNKSLEAEEILLEISPGIVYINGYEINVTESTTISVPYYTIGSSVMIDSVFISYRTLEQLMLPNLWSYDKSYKKGEYCFFNGNEYVAMNDLPQHGTDPVLDKVGWKFIERIDESIWQTKIPYFHYSIGETTLLSNGKYDYNTDIPENSLLIARIVKKPFSKPQVELNENARAYLMSDIKDMHAKTIDLFENIARIQSSIELNTGEVANSCFDVYTDSFYGDEYRDTELEYLSGLQSANSIGGKLVPSINWTQFQSTFKNLQINPKDISVLTSQENYTGSSLINEFSVAVNSGYIFELPQYEFIADTLSITNTKNVSITNPTVTNTITNRVRGWSWNTRSGSTTTSNTSSVLSTTTNLVSDTIEQVQQQGKYFYPNTLNIEISLPKYCFNSSEKVNIYVGTEKITTILSKVDGSFYSVISIQAGKLKDTNYNLILKGVDSSAQAQSVIRIIPKIRTLTYDRINTTTWTTVNTVTNTIVTFWNDGRGGNGGNGGGGDPLAQTFLCTESCYIYSISVIFDLMSATGATRMFNTSFNLPDNVNLYITETTAGKPDSSKIIHIQSLLPGELCNNTVWKEIIFSKAIKLEKDKMYAMFFETTDKIQPRNITGVQLETSGRICLRTAEIGKRWLYSPFNIVNTQPYINGVMFKASNITTWSEYQNMDLAFIVKKLKFNSSQSFTENIIVNGKYTDMFLSAEEITPESTSISYTPRVHYSDGTYDDYIVKDGVIESVNNSNKTISNVENIVVLNTTNENITPTLLYTGLKFGNVNTKSVYITKNIDLNYGNDVITKDLKITISPCDNFDESKIEIYYTTDEVISNSSWIKFGSASSGFNNEKTYIANNVSMYNNLRIKIILNVDPENTNTRISIKQMRVFYI